jgi:polysaccharide export outer membrane protein
VVVLPDQMVDRMGTINVPFVGPVKAVGRNLSEIEADIKSSLTGKANQPQVVARLVRNVSSNVTVVGEVGASAVVPLTARGERLLDALAAAGGVRQPVGKITIQLSRGGRVEALPLDTIIRDPRQNVPLKPADVVTALFQPYSFTALGATGKNEEVNFETQGITLAQALARSGGLIDARSDPKGVFIFRFEPKTALPWGHEPVTAPDGRVPVVYRIDLKDPASFFIAQRFPMSDKDVLYVSNAPVAETQKFLNLLFSIVYPLTATSTSILR